MNSYIIDLQQLRTTIMTFLDENRDKVALPNADFARVSVEERRREASKSPKGSLVREEYREDVERAVNDLLTGMVYVAIRETFKSVPATYNSYFTEAIMKMALPNAHSLYALYCDQDDDVITSDVLDEEEGVVSLDDAMITFDELYIEAISFLSNFNFDSNATVEFEILTDTLKLKVGGDYRIAIFDAIFKDGWNGPMVNIKGEFDLTDTKDLAYLSRVSEAVKG